MFVGKFLKIFNTCVISAHLLLYFHYTLLPVRMLKEGITSGTVCGVIMELIHS